MFFQNTICNDIRFEGKGIHTGEQSTVLIKPAPVDTGIVFVQWGEDPSNGVQAHIDNLIQTNNSITIGKNGNSIQTIEHFMAVFYAYDIQNLFVFVDGHELPILDGSSVKIAEAVEHAGIQVQNAFSEVFYIPYPVWVEEDGRYLIALPSDDYKVTYTIDFSSKSTAVGTQTACFNVEKETFRKFIAPARTFGFSEDLDGLKNKNLALGGTLDNALLYTQDRLVNKGLRFENECVRHKILDLIGDLSLTGYKMRGHFIAYKAGHTMDAELVRRIARLINRKKITRTVSSTILKKKEIEFIRFKRRMNLS